MKAAMMVGKLHESMSLIGEYLVSALLCLMAAARYSANFQMTFAGKVWPRGTAFVLNLQTLHPTPWPEGEESHMLARIHPLNVRKSRPEWVLSMESNPFN